MTSQGSSYLERVAALSKKKRPSSEGFEGDTQEGKSQLERIAALHNEERDADLKRNYPVGEEFLRNAAAGAAENYLNVPFGGPGTVLPEVQEMFEDEALSQGMSPYEYLRKGGEKAKERVLSGLYEGLDVNEQPSSFAGKSGRFFGEIASLPGPASLKSTVAGTAAAGFGGPLAGMAGMILGGPKKWTPTEAQKAMQETLGHLGLSKEAIVQATKNPKTFGTRLLSWITKGSKGAKDSISRVEDSFGGAFRALKESPDGQKSLGIAKDVFNDLIVGLRQEIPTSALEGAGTRGYVAGGLESVLKDLEKAKTWGDVIGAYRQANKLYTLGLPESGIITERLGSVLQRKFPEFQPLNQAYKNFLGFAKQIKGREGSLTAKDLIKEAAKEAGFFGVLHSLFSLASPNGVSAKTTAIISHALRPFVKGISRRVLLDPKFQSLSKQGLRAVREGKIPLAVQTFKKMREFAEKQSEEEE